MALKHVCTGSPVDGNRLSRSWQPSSPRQRFCGWNALFGSCIVLSAISLIFALCQLLYGTWGQQLYHMQHFRTSSDARANDVLVMYIFSNTDPQYLSNLHFFLREGVHSGDGCEYIFVVNRSPDDPVRQILH
jgi:hypothetical protein